MALVTGIPQPVINIISSILADELPPPAGDILGDLLDWIAGSSDSASSPDAAQLSAISQQLGAIQTQITLEPSLTVNLNNYKAAITAVSGAVSTATGQMNWTDTASQTSALKGMTDGGYTILCAMADRNTSGDYYSLISNLIYSTYGVTLDELITNTQDIYSGGSCYANDLLAAVVNSATAPTLYAINYPLICLALNVAVVAASAVTAASLSFAALSFADANNLYSQDISKDVRDSVKSVLANSAIQKDLVPTNNVIPFFTYLNPYILGAPGLVCTNAFALFSNLANSSQGSADKNCLILGNNGSGTELLLGIPEKPVSIIPQYFLYAPLLLAPANANPAYNQFPVNMIDIKNSLITFGSSGNVVISWNMNVNNDNSALVPTLALSAPENNLYCPSIWQVSCVYQSATNNFLFVLQNLLSPGVYSNPLNGSYTGPHLSAESAIGAGDLWNLTCVPV